MGDSVRIFQDNWGVEDYLSWEEDLKINKPQVLKKLREMAEEENERVLNYYK